MISIGENVIAFVVLADDYETIDDMADNEKDLHIHPLQDYKLGRISIAPLKIDNKLRIDGIVDKDGNFKILDIHYHYKKGTP